MAQVEDIEVTTLTFTVTTKVYEHLKKYGYVPILMWHTQNCICNDSEAEVNIKAFEERGLVFEDGKWAKKGGKNA